MALTLNETIKSQQSSAAFDAAAEDLASLFFGAPGEDETIEDQMGMLNQQGFAYRQELRCPSPSAENIAWALRAGKRVVGEVLCSFRGSEAVVWIDTSGSTEAEPLAYQMPEPLSYKTLDPERSRALHRYIMRKLGELASSKDSKPSEQLGLYQLLIAA